jgi:hypothetical protein
VSVDVTARRWRRVRRTACWPHDCPKASTCGSAIADRGIA